jgi:hypothetical protein
LWFEAELDAYMLFFEICHLLIKKQIRANRIHKLTSNSVPAGQQKLQLSSGMAIIMDKV